MKWDYRDVEPFPYGESPLYEIGMRMLDDCETVEDWGCGTAWAKQFRDGPYVGIDGAEGYADIVADLRTYTSDVEGIFMRGVLEHNHEWKPILQNAMVSATKRLVLVLFTPMADATHVIGYTRDDIPDISFAPADIEAYFGGRKFICIDHETDTQFGVERIYSVTM